MQSTPFVIFFLSKPSWSLPFSTFDASPKHPTRNLLQFRHGFFPTSHRQCHISVQRPLSPKGDPERISDNSSWVPPQPSGLRLPWNSPGSRRWGRACAIRVSLPYVLPCVLGDEPLITFPNVHIKGLALLLDVPKVSADYPNSDSIIYISKCFLDNTGRTFLLLAIEDDFITLCQLLSSPVTWSFTDFSEEFRYEQYQTMVRSQEIPFQSILKDVFSSSTFCFKLIKCELICSITFD